mmetsp:Transcript_84953/g.216404  ORF Transcript_84953/g.216404 Transcript_84953/m.216404 type:complete len:204 (-) Transcript_84953:133-744(-)
MREDGAERPFLDLAGEALGQRPRHLPCREGPPVALPLDAADHLLPAGRGPRGRCVAAAAGALPPAAHARGEREEVIGKRGDRRLATLGQRGRSDVSSCFLQSILAILCSGLRHSQRSHFNPPGPPRAPTRESAFAHCRQRGRRLLGGRFEHRGSARPKAEPRRLHHRLEPRPSSRGVRAGAQPLLAARALPGADPRALGAARG